MRKSSGIDCRASLTSESGQPVERLGLGRAQPGRGVRLGPCELPVLDVLGGALLRLALLLAVGVDERVGEDAVQPGLEVRALGELVEGRERLHEGLLDEVLGVGRVAGHPQRRGVQLVEEGQRVALEPCGPLLRGLLDRTHLLATDVRVGGHSRGYRPLRPVERGRSRPGMYEHAGRTRRSAAFFPAFTRPGRPAAAETPATASATISSASPWVSSARAGTANPWSACGTGTTSGRAARRRRRPAPPQ